MSNELDDPILTSGGVLTEGRVASLSSLSDTSLATIETGHQSIASTVKRRRIKRRKKELDIALDIMLNAVEKLLHLQKETKIIESLRLYKRKTPSALFQQAKLLVKQNENEEEWSTMIDSSEEWLLEKATISCLNKMMSDSETHINISNVDFKAGKSATPDFKIIKGYLNQFKEKHGMEFNIKGTSIMRDMYKLDADNIFTTEEMRIIKWRKVLFHRKRKILRKLKINKRKSKLKPEAEVWEWKDFVNYSINEPTDESDSSTTSSQSVVVENQDMNRRLKRYLKSWLDREYPLQDKGAFNHKFHFYELRHIKPHKLVKDEKRLQDSVHFVRLALIAYPDIDASQILTDLAPYFGNEEIPTIAKRENSAKDDTKLAAKMKLLEQMGASYKKPKNLKAEKMIEKQKNKEANKTEILERMKHIAKLYDLEALYYKFQKADFPTPYDSLYVEIIKDLCKMYQGAVEGGKLDKVILKFLRKMSHLIFNSVKWLIGSLLKSHIWRHIEDEDDTHSSKKKETTFGKNIKQRKDAYHEVKKAMVAIIKYQNLQGAVSKIVNKYHPDLSSSESMSLQKENKTYCILTEK